MDEATKGTPTTPGCAAVHSGDVGPYLDALAARVAAVEQSLGIDQPASAGEGDGQSEGSDTGGAGAGDGDGDGA